ncbi:MAG: hypothetical protein C4537_07155 [Acholeplasma sp.]|jgi:guanylate kinase|nr:MAG: hypothetical protein C4537_07155 [Acholeplasma sp.]
MIVLVGASASGKTEIAKKLYQNYHYHKCITTTTRPPRSHEIADLDYHFLSEEAFDQKVKEDAFYEVSFYHQYRYGIQKKDVLKGGVVIVEPHGANTLIKKAPKEVFIVYVDTSEAMREKRMIERGDQPLIVKSRLENDRLVFNKALISRIDLILENEDHTLDELANMVHHAYQNLHQGS